MAQINSKATVTLRNTVVVHVEGHCFEDRSVGINGACEDERVVVVEGAFAGLHPMTADEFAETMSEDEWNTVAEALLTNWDETRWGN